MSFKRMSMMFAAAGIAAAVLPAYAGGGNLQLQLLDPVQPSAQAQVQVTGDLRGRAGPGTGYATLFIIPAGTIVPIYGCLQALTWCQTGYGGQIGWSSTAYMVVVGGGMQGQPLPNVGTQIGLQLFNLIAGQLFGLGQQPQQPQPPVPVTQVCFYANANYGGQSFCVQPNQGSTNLGQNWTNRISSIFVAGNVEVQVCDDPDLWGWCETYVTSQSNLPNNRDNDITSYRLRFN
jgi:hypothetical protein